MPDDGYTEDVVHRRWNDKTGERIEVGPDPDGLDLVEIRTYSSDDAMEQRVTITADQAAWLGRLFGKVYADA